MEKIYCLFCGQDNALSSIQCSSCGKPLPKVKEKNSGPQSHAIPITYSSRSSLQRQSGADTKGDKVRRAFEKIAFDLESGGNTEDQYREKVEEIASLVSSIRDEYQTFLSKVRWYKESSPDDIYNYLDIYEIEAGKQIESFTEHFSISIDCLRKIPKGAVAHYLEEAIDNALHATECIEQLDRLTDETDEYMKRVEERISTKAVE
jgi:vacuolar-type H+-ATPase subunit I/STV1